MSYQEERHHRSAMWRPEAPGGEEQLFERAVGETAAQVTPSRPSLLQPQHDCNIVWRWHIRRRRRNA